MTSHGCWFIQRRPRRGRTAAGTTAGTCAKATRGYSVGLPGAPDFVRTGIQLGVDQVFGHYDIASAARKQALSSAG
jgi:hypothetical protein